MKMENLLSLSTTYTWYLKKDYNKFYSFELYPRMIRDDWELFQLLADEREKAIEHLLWSGLWANNTSLASL